MSDKKGKIEKSKRVKQEIERLNSVLADLGVNSKKLEAVESLIENAAFMSITLKDLRQEINKEGCVSEYQNGENQWGTKQSPEVKTYNQMLRNHMTVTKQLTSLLPENKQDKGEDELKKFVESRGK